MSVKPIETIYKGYKFRSRLEARWAVFFDALDIDWQYEYEGFNLGTLGYYLPDFYLPHSRYFVEVKPIQLTDAEKRKVNALDESPPAYAVGCFPVIGLPEESEFEFDAMDCPCAWSGNTSFLLLQEGLREPEAVMYAVVAARQARFEYGESPSVQVAA